MYVKASFPCLEDGTQKIVQKKTGKEKGRERTLVLGGHIRGPKKKQKDYLVLRESTPTRLTSKREAGGVSTAVGGLTSKTFFAL